MGDGRSCSRREEVEDLGLHRQIFRQILQLLLFHRELTRHLLQLLLELRFKVELVPKLQRGLVGPLGRSENGCARRTMPVMMSSLQRLLKGIQ